MMQKIDILLIIILIIFSLFGCGTKNESDQVLLSLDKNWKFRQIDSGEWKTAFVPGNIYSDLYIDTIIDKPLHRNNSENLFWVETKNWEYKNSFSVNYKISNKDNIFLVFKGIDTYAKVYLNDSLVLTADNMFAEWKIDCKKYIKFGTNELKVKFYLGDNKFADYPVNSKIPFRKSAIQFGLDVAPKLTGCGIWKSVYIIAYDKFMIDDVEIVQKNITDSVANISVNFVINSAKAQSTSLETIISDSLSFSENYNLTEGLNIINQEITINNPKLWYPNGIGEQNLYKFDFSFKSENKLVENKQITTGLRTVDFTEDSLKNKTFKINGLIVNLKGVNYVNQLNISSGLKMVSEENLIKYAKESNVNFINISGIGIYQSDEFYENCDKAGILVMQEIPLNYSEIVYNQQFENTITNELTQNINRLKNHPSLLFWSFKYNEENADIQKTDKLLKSLVNKLNPNTFYISSINNKQSLNNYNLDIYTTNNDFFYNFGLSSFLSYKNLQLFTVPSDLDLNSYVLKRFFYGHEDYDTLKTILDTYYVIPNTLEKLIYLSQIIQAEQIKKEYSDLKIKNQNYFATIISNLNDCCPSVSASGIDYFGEWKTAQYYVKQIYSNIYIIVKEESSKINVYISSDFNSDKVVEISMRLADFKGKSVWKQNSEIKLTANSTKCYFSFDKFKISKGKSIESLVFKTKIVENKIPLAESFDYFQVFKNQKLKEPAIVIDVLKSDNGYVLELKTDYLAKNIFLTSLAEGHFEKNFFDLLPGESKFVKFVTTSEILDFAANFKTFTMYDALFLI